MLRAKFFARTALGLALAMGVAVGSATPIMAKAKVEKPKETKLSPSKAYIPVYLAAKAAIDAAVKRPDVLAARTAVVNAQAVAEGARTKKAQTEANARVATTVTALGTLLAPEKALVEKTVAVGTTADDKELSGQLLFGMGDMAFDPAMQRRGLQMRIESGKNTATLMPLLYAKVGSFSYELKEYAAARAASQKALDLGYTGTDASITIAQSYIKDNQAPMGLKVLHDLTLKMGASAPENWFNYGVMQSYGAKLPGEAAYFGSELVSRYPSQSNWTLAIVVVRDLNQFQGLDQIDLLRLMERTRSYSESRDYVDYIQALSKRGMPGEALKIIDQGIASKMLMASDQFVVDAKKESLARVASDRASLAAQERDARGPKATVASITAAADTMLSYDQPAKAEELYLLALAKPGVDGSKIYLRLGIAQSDQGKYADAQASLAKVTDARAPIAQLWSSYAKAKAAGK